MMLKSQFCHFCNIKIIFYDQINAALVSIRDYFQKHDKKIVETS